MPRNIQELQPITNLGKHLKNDVSFVLECINYIRWTCNNPESGRKKKIGPIAVDVMLFLSSPTTRFGTPELHSISGIRGFSSGSSPSITNPGRLSTAF